MNKKNKLIKSAKTLGIIMGGIATILPSMVIWACFLFNNIIYKTGLHRLILYKLGLYKVDIIFEPEEFIINYISSYVFPVHSFIALLGVVSPYARGQKFEIPLWLMISVLYGVMFYYIGKNLYTINQKKSKIILCSLLIFMVIMHISSAILFTKLISALGSF